MTYFNHTNCDPRTRVFDVDTKDEIKLVKGIDTHTGVVECFESPYRVDGEYLATYTYRYREIHPIYGGGDRPCLFHCYGRLK